jgi:hypothetical protein
MIKTKHELKTRHEFFRVAWAGKKPFEIRINDRDYSVDDEIELNEIDDEGTYTGRTIYGFIDYVSHFEQKPGWVVFSYHETGRSE